MSVYLPPKAQVHLSLRPLDVKKRKDGLFVSQPWMFFTYRRRAPLQRDMCIASEPCLEPCM
jgi:hypothetical protein